MVRAKLFWGPRPWFAHSVVGPWLVGHIWSVAARPRNSFLSLVFLFTITSESQFLLPFARRLRGRARPPADWGPSWSCFRAVLGLQTVRMFLLPGTFCQGLFARGRLPGDFCQGLFARDLLPGPLSAAIAAAVVATLTVLSSKLRKRLANRFPIVA